MENQIELTSSVEVIEAQQRAEYDIQIMTAKRYPRELKRFADNCVAIVSSSKEVANTCHYDLPRGGKSISGPSVHLARILAQQYGNLRVDAKVKQITDKQVISEAVCFDLETNYACKVEVRKSIIDKYGKRYKDDMITVTGNATNAIAFRNAVFNVIPKGLTNKVYEAALNTVAGDLSNEQKLLTARKNCLDIFANEYGVKEKQILDVLNLKASSQIKRDQLIKLNGIRQAIDDGDSTVDEIFNPKPTPEEKKDKMKSNPNKTELP